MPKFRPVCRFFSTGVAEWPLDLRADAHGRSAPHWRLPCCHPGVVKPLRAVATAPPARPALLVVDDDATNRDLLSRRLVPLGFSVTTAASGAEALQVLRDAPCDAVLLDVMMPEQSGLEVLTEIRRDARTRQLPVIMVTARSGSDDIVEALGLGANDYVTKPVDFAVAAARVRAQLARVAAEHETLASQRRDDLQHAQKLSAIGQLTSGVAHDFNNVLATIHGYGEQLHEELPPDDRRRRYAEKIITAVETGAGLTRQLLAVSRRGGSTVRALDLRDSARSMAELLAPSFGWRMQVELSTAPVPCLVEADAGQIDQLLLNLLINARDAMPDGGRIQVQVDAVPATAAAPGGWVRLTVSDTGVGIDEVTRARMFEPFFTTKPEGRGTGLGLAMVQAIVDRSGGKIAVDSAPGAGTTFTILLPHVISAARLPGPAATPVGAV